MARTADKAAQIDRFSRKYRHARSEVIRRIERSVFGCDYGATSWTTRHEAEDVGEMLALGPGRRLLEIGSGSGWPGLYLAATTGCDVALIDLPIEGLRVAAERAASDCIGERCFVAMADGAALPFGSARFDAIFHSDVLCCLEAKLAVLKECRRVIRDTGKLVFSVLSITPNLSSGDYERAVASGPPFIATTVDYPTMLRQARWQTTDRVDMTAGFFGTVRDLLDQEESYADELTELLGEGEYSDRLTSRRKRIEGLEQGLIRRELFSATPMPLG